MNTFCQEHAAPTAFCVREGLHGESVGVRASGALRVARTQIGEVLSERLIRDLRNEAIRAHRKHTRPENGGGSLIDPGLSIVKRLAALGEELGEVFELFTYDKGVGDDLTEAEWTAALRKELIQVANVALTWAQSLDRDEVQP